MPKQPKKPKRTARTKKSTPSKRPAKDREVALAVSQDTERLDWLGQHMHGNEGPECDAFGRYHVPPWTGNAEHLREAIDAARSLA